MDYLGYLLSSCCVGSTNLSPPERFPWLEPLTSALNAKSISGTWQGAQGRHPKAWGHWHCIFFGTPIVCDADPAHMALWMCESIQNSARNTALQLFNFTQATQGISKLFFLLEFSRCCWSCTAPLNLSLWHMLIVHVWDYCQVVSSCLKLLCSCTLRQSLLDHGTSHIKYIFIKSVFSDIWSKVEWLTLWFCLCVFTGQELF